MAHPSKGLSFSLLFFVLIIPIKDGWLGAQEPLEVHEELKKEVIYKVADYMKKYYVFEKIGRRMGEHIKTLYNAGSYDKFTDVIDFCGQVTADLRKISNDKHIFVFFSPEEAKEVAARQRLLSEDEIEEINRQYSETDRRANYGFNKIEILEGNVGYLNLSYFSSSNRARETAIGAMKFLANSDAVIIDLRSNGGGGGGGVGQLLASYFFGKKRFPLSGVYYRSSGVIDKTWTLSQVPGKRMPDVGLYILTSSRTFSAAENFAYSLKHLKRAIIVGERTKGGAHPVDVMIVKGNILIQISIGNSVNPITGTNWEETGVLPDIEVAEDQALSSAHLHALRALESRTTDAQQKKTLQELIEHILRNFS